MHPLLTKLKDQFPDAVLGVREEGPYQDLVAQVEPAAVPEIARFLHDDPAMSFDMLSDIISVDSLEYEERFEETYLIKSLSRNNRIRIKARLPDANQTIPTFPAVCNDGSVLKCAV